MRKSSEEVYAHGSTTALPSRRTGSGARQHRSRRTVSAQDGPAHRRRRRDDRPRVAGANMGARNRAHGAAGAESCLVRANHCCPLRCPFRTSAVATAADGGVLVRAAVAWQAHPVRHVRRHHHCHGRALRAGQVRREPRGPSAGRSGLACRRDLPPRARPWRAGEPLAGGQQRGSAPWEPLRGAQARTPGAGGRDRNHGTARRGSSTENRHAGLSAATRCTRRRAP